MNISQNDFYRTLSLLSYVLVPFSSQKVLRNHGSNDAGAAHAHPNFGRRNNENYLPTTEIPSIRTFPYQVVDWKPVLNFPVFPDKTPKFRALPETFGNQSFMSNRVTNCVLIVNVRRLCNLRFLVAESGRNEPVGNETGGYLNASEGSCVGEGENHVR